MKTLSHAKEISSTLANHAAYVGHDCSEGLRIVHQKRRDLAFVLEMAAKALLVPALVHASLLAQGADDFDERVAAVVSQ